MKDDEIRDRFGELRHRESKNVPSFEHIVRSAHEAAGHARGAHEHHPARPARGKHVTRVRGAQLLVAAAVVALVASGVYATVSLRSAVTDVQLADWRAQSDDLLPATDSDLLRMIPPLGSSVLDTLLQ
jgi:hypothetical protein